MLGMGAQELIIVLIVVVLLFGGKKIPELMRGVGKGLGEFKHGVEEAKVTARRALQESDDIEVAETYIAKKDSESTAVKSIS